LVHVTRPRALLALAIGALFLVAFGLIRAAGPTYSSGVDDISWFTTVSLEHPEVGDEVVVGFSASYSPAPNGQSPFFAQTPHVVQNDEQPPVAVIEHVEGYGAVLRLRALRPGVALVWVSGSFEKFGCFPTPTPAPPPFPGPCFPKGFEFVDTPQVEITIAPACGDANGDGVVNSIDAAWTLQYAAGMIQTIVFPAGADVNDDGAADAVDATLVLQVDAALLSPDALHCPPPTTP
jgi:hypothetical protein